MSNAVRYYKRHSMDELIVMQRDIENCPENKAHEGGIYLFTAPARRKLRDIAAAIAFHLEDKRSESGRLIPVNGFSGRKSKK